MIIPGVQNPHCSAWQVLNERCSGCNSPLADSPSIVVTSCPSASTANIVQDLMPRPSTSTVHAPQLVVSHPTTVPVLPSTSRRYCTSKSRGSTSSVYCTPSTVRLIVCVPMPSVAPLPQRSCGAVTL